MKKFKLITAVLVIAGLLAAGGAVFASVMSPEMLEQKKEILDQRVAEGVITQETSDAIYEAMQNCDGSRLQLGKEYGICFGKGNGNGFLMKGEGTGRRLRMGCSK